MRVALLVNIPSIVLGELYFGAERSDNAKKNKKVIDKLKSSSSIVYCDALTAERYGLIKNQLFNIGKPIPENDIWIAAMATQHDYTILSNDKHFEDIEKIKMMSY